MGADAPDLVAQRVSAGSEAFAALQRAFSSNNEGIRALAEPRLLGLCRDVLREYASAERRALAEKAGKTAGLPQPAQLLDSATPLALEALAFVRDLDAQAFAKHCAWLVPVLSELIVCQSVPLRTTVAAVFATRLPSALLSTTRPERVQTPTDAALAAPVFSQPADVASPTRHPGTVSRAYKLFESPA